MTYYGVSYLPPTSSSATFYSSSFNTANEALTYQTALDNFLAYPTAQGTENLKTTNVSGVLTLTNDLIINGPTGPTANYIQFTDGTQQSTAFVEANYAQLNTNNLFLQPFSNTFEGNNSSSALTAPLVISNSQTSNKASLYIDDANNLDATLYSNQTDGGLTIRNAGGFSFTVAPLGASNTATFANPISCGSNSLTCGAISGSQLTLSSGGQTSVLTTTASGLNVADSIVSTGNISGTGLGVASTGNDSYLITSGSSAGYGMVVANTSGNNCEITLSNNGPKFASIACTDYNVLDFGGASLTVGPLGVAGGVSCQAISCSTLNTNGNTLTTGTVNAGAITGSQLTLTSGANTSILTTTPTGLDVADTITVPTQTYPLTSSNQVATISYVNQVANQIVGAYYIGQIITGIFTTPPPNFLYTDGTYYSTQLYPQLYALIGNAYDAYNGGTQSGMYSVPNTIQRFLVDSNGTIASAGKNIPSYGDAFNNNLPFGGSNQTNQFVSHSHGYGTGYSNVAVGSNSGTCATQTGGTPNYYSTSSAGNGATIKNIPYYMAINYFIYAGNP
jgi:hypothetical protein